MEMGYSANYADVIEWNAVKELCPAEAQALEAVLRKYGIDEEDLADCFMYEPPRIDDLADRLEIDLTSEAGTAELSGEDAGASAAERAVAEVTAAWEALQEAFKRATRTGDSYLTLYVDYHDSDSAGDRYDDVDGVFWAVDGAYQLSPAGERFKDKVERRFFVNFG